MRFLRGNRVEIFGELLDLVQQDHGDRGDDALAGGGDVLEATDCEKDVVDGNRGVWVGDETGCRDLVVVSGVFG